jgi:hypothetical protein
MNRYDNETLDRWAKRAPGPKWTQVRSVLLDALLGLGHLHANIVIHGDVKPANILVDGRERGRLADFDISIDTKDRTSALRITSRSTIRATAGYAAPELKELNEATRHTDMFAFGRTVEAVNESCEPGDAASDGVQGVQGVNEQARGQAATLIQALTAPSPSDRPSAEAAMQSPFFTILKEACRITARKCTICLEDTAAGLECVEAHWHCDPCLARHAKDFLNVENLGRLKERGGTLKCSKFPLECNSGFSDDRDLCQHLPADLFKTYLVARVDIIKSQLRAQLEAEMKKQLEAELQRLTVLEALTRKVLVARTHIVDQILTLACPRPGCGQAFLDFEGCFALRCRRCPCGFCGWCLADCGNDAHAHVRQCAQRPQNADTYFGTREQFEAAQRKRQTALIRSYLAQQADGNGDASHAASLTAEILEACKSELQANNLWPLPA